MAVYRTTPFFTKTILEDLITLNNSSKFELISTIWPNSGLSTQTFKDNEYTSFVEYIGEEFSHLREHQSRFAAETVDGTVDLIQVLRSNVDKSQEGILQLLRNQFRDVDDAAILRSLELTMRLWLTINVHSESLAIGPVRANVGTVEWSSELSPKDLVHSQFQSLHLDAWPDEKSSKAQLDPSFTASFLVNICGIKISWTHNLADHLVFDKRRRIITVYEHKICLLNHSKDLDSLIPHTTLHEAIDTLNLLFPFGDSSTRELIQREQKLPLYRLGFCDRPRMVALADYNVWRTRLADLVEVFNEPPRNLKQLLNDRRNVSGWATFWIGILVLILTLISIAFGTVSTVYAIKQYNLALAQACSTEGAAQLLSNYCR